MDEALCNACEAGHLPDVIRLLDQGANINATCRGGRCKPLQIALQKKHTNVIKYLISAGCDLSTYIQLRKYGGRLPIHMPAILENPSLLESVLSTGFDINATCQHKKMTPLLYAVRDLLDDGKCFEVAQCCIENSADIEATDKYGNTSLIHACQRTGVKIAEYLIEQGANKYVFNKDGDTCLLAACYTENIELVGYLLDQGVNVECANALGHTPFMVSCTKQNLAIAKLLISKGCDYMAKDLHGLTALHAASKCGHLTIVKFWNSRGFPIDSITRRQMGPATLRDGRMDQSEFYYGELYNYGVTPMMYACVERHLEVVKFLHSAGCDLTWENDKQETCLHLAFNKDDNLPVCKYLARYGDVNKPNFNGKSPAHLFLTRYWGEAPKLDLDWLFDNGACLDKRHAEIHTGRSKVSSAFPVAVKNNYYSRLSTEIQHKVYQRLFLLSLDQYEFEMAKLFAADILGLQLSIQMLSLTPEFEKDASSMVPGSCCFRRRIEWARLQTWLDNVESNPFSLRHLCRLTMRKCLQTPLRVKLSQITLPTYLKDYVMYRAGEIG